MQAGSGWAGGIPNPLGTSCLTDNTYSNTNEHAIIQRGKNIRNATTHQVSYNEMKKYNKFGF